MTRQTRTLMIIGIVAVAGVVALAMLADRYRRVAALRSVDDVTHVGAVTDADPSGGETAEATSGGLPIVQRIRVFVDVRSAIRAGLEDGFYNPSIFFDPETRQVRDDLIAPHQHTLAAIWQDLKDRRVEALEGSGLSEDEYGMVRDAYRKWRDAEIEALDPAVRKAFQEVGDEELAAADLGMYDVLDN